MARTSKVVFYLGNDDLCFSKIEEHFFALQTSKSSPANKIEKININGPTWYHKLISLIRKIPPHLIFIDFCDVEKEKLSEISYLMLLLQKITKYRNTILVGLFARKSELMSQIMLFNCGLNYAYIKRGRHDQSFLLDARYLTFAEEVSLKKYAVAPIIDTPYKLSFLGRLTELSATKIRFESDLEFAKDEQGPEISFNLFDEFVVPILTVEQTYDDTEYNYRQQYICRIPYPGPWDEVKEDILYQDTVETWLDDQYKNNILIKYSVLLVNTDLSLLGEIYEMVAFSQFSIAYRESAVDAPDIIKTIAPEILVFNLSKAASSRSESTDGGMSWLLDILQCIKETESYSPLIVLFNCKSESNAYQKVYNYEYILAHSHLLDIKLVSKMLSLFWERDRDNRKVGKMQYIPSCFNLDGVIEIKKEIIVTSLTEHDITFLSTEKLHNFTVLMLDQPSEIFATIVPPTRALSRTKEHYHYMAFINGVDDRDLSLLRIFVNQMVFTPPKEFKFIKGSLKDEELEDGEEKTLDEEVEEVEEVEDSVEDDDELIYVRRKNSNWDK